MVNEYAWLSKPMAVGLLISAALHFTFVVLFQTHPESHGRQVVLINARLQPAKSATAPKPVTSIEPEIPQPKLSEPERRVSAEKEPLTALSPSIAPPIVARDNPVRPPKTEEKSAPDVLAALQPTPASQPSAPRTDAPPAQRNEATEARAATPPSNGLPTLPINIDSNWYQARQVDKQPKSIGVIEPEYPEDAARRNIEGTLKLMLKIDDLGRVQSAEVVEATPPGVFDEAALAAFRAARFRPAMKDGRPVRYQAYMRVDFKLQD